MKKAYKKPLLIVERFALSQTIAAGCTDMSIYGGQPLVSRQLNCAWDFSGIRLFLQDNYNCEYPVEHDGWAGACYNAPAEGLRLFRS